jgi:hypothetical protein
MTLQRLQANQKWDKQSENILNSWPKQIEAISSSISVINATLTQINYTEGNFTPVVTFGGGSTGITYTAQSGVYTRVGRLVHVEIVILLSSKGSSTGAAVITGLPLTVAQSTAAAGIQASALTAGVGDTYLMAVFDGAATTITLQDIAAGLAASITDVDFTNTTLLRIGGVYRTSA